MPFSIVVHIHNEWIESSLVNFHPSPSVMLHLEARFQGPKHWDPTLAIVVLKLIWPTLILGMVDIVLQWVDRIISCKSSSFSIRDVASRSTLPRPQTLKPNTYNSYSKANLTNTNFGNGGHCFVRVTSLSHFCCVLARARLTTFWSFRLYTTMAFPKIRTFILAWSWCWGSPIEVESLLGLAFFATKPCTSFKCLVNNHLAQYAPFCSPIG